MHVHDSKQLHSAELRKYLHYAVAGGNYTFAIYQSQKKTKSEFEKHRTNCRQKPIDNKFIVALAHHGAGRLTRICVYMRQTTHIR